MDKLKLFLILFTAILSVVVLLCQPKMHKQTVITDYQYTFIDEEADINKEIAITPKSNPNVNIGITPQKSTAKPKTTVKKTTSKISSKKTTNTKITT